MQINTDDIKIIKYINSIKKLKGRSMDNIDYDDLAEVEEDDFVNIYQLMEEQGLDYCEKGLRD